MRKEDIHLKTLAVTALTAAMLAAGIAMTAAMLACPAYAEGSGEIDAEMSLDNISKFGNIKLMTDGRIMTKEDLSAAGIDYGDVVTVSFLDQQIEMPVVGDFSEVDTGVTLLREDDQETELAINMGDFASTYIADKSNFEDGTFAWTFKKGISDVTFHIKLRDKGGFYSEYGHDGLVYSDERSDYPDLTDEQFANFRVIETTGMGKGVLYRSASPVDPKRKRNSYADAACKAHGIATVMNLADSEDTVKNFPGYDGSYYSTTDCIALNMGLVFDDQDFKDKLAEGLRYFISHDGPYLVHCTEGKDRAGAVSAILECLMGATYDEVVDDYMVTYYNYYGITKDDERYDKLVEENIAATLKKLNGVDDLTTADLAAEAEKYCKEIGLTDDEIAALRANLGGQAEQNGETEKTDYTSVAVFVVAFAAGLLVAGIMKRKKRAKRS